MAEPFLGMIMTVGYTFAPRGWAFCAGQLMAIAQNDALFSLLGTTYGGDGVTTFALPNLQSRIPIHQGKGPGLSTYVLGQAAGTESVTLLNTQIPVHTHIVNATAAASNQASPVNHIWGSEISAATFVYADPSVSPIDTTMNPAAISLAGGSQPHENIMPYLAMNYVIALQGIYPTQS